MKSAGPHAIVEIDAVLAGPRAADPTAWRSHHGQGSQLGWSGRAGALGARCDRFDRALPSPWSPSPSPVRIPMRFLLRRLGQWAWPVMLIQSGPRDPTPPATHLTAGARPHPRAAEQIRRAPGPVQGVYRRVHVARRRMVPQQKVGVSTLHPPTRPIGQSQDRVCARSHFAMTRSPVLAAVAGKLSELAPELIDRRCAGRNR